MFMKNRLSIAIAILFTALTGCLSEVEDETAPLIFVLGNNPQYMRLNTAFKDTGVMVTDNNAIYKIWTDVSGLDTSNAGRYNVNYFAEDFNSNVSQKTRVVVVKIEGPNLEGKWNGQRLEPPDAGTPELFEDSIQQLSDTKVRFMNIGGFSSKTLSSDLLGNLGDTLGIYPQVIQTTPTTVVSFTGAGKISTNGRSFEIGYQRIIDNSGDKDTLFGKLIYQKQQ
jgi:hypothetical protein